jgi:polymorphic membrane protein
MRDGNLVVIDSIFEQNKAAPLGPDTGGGAIYIEGSKSGVLVVKSTFLNNAASNAGAVGALNAELDVYDSLITGNTATGHDANNADQTMCSVMNNGQYEIGSGGNGGALYGDGDTFNVVVCGDDIENNAAGTNAFGGGIFFTSDDFSGTLTIQDSVVEGNTGGHWTNVKSGTVTNAGTAVGTNAKSITIANSMVQGYP